MANIKLDKIDILTFFQNHTNLIYDTKHGNEYYFKKQGQKTGSIAVNLAKCFFFDHSDGVGGNIYKAYELFYNNSVINESSYCLKHDIIVENTFELIAIKEVTNTLLVKFFSEERGINIAYLDYVKEIRYKFNGKYYFTLGWLNVNKGYNTQNSLFKRVIYDNGPTILIKNKNFVKINFFESYFDYLAYLTYTNDTDTDAIILNSTSFAKYNFSLELYKEIDLYLDNDDAGNKATSYILNNYKNSRDKRFYSCKDYNAFILL